ncbi:UNVERIFIED_CONTAM: hypothetical protein HDU68_011330 [Siphonaria sp. JEL0065]|nr:hypothetical protein HDU68_011330 [Siphonaria sp. JEL0065]
MFNSPRTGKRGDRQTKAQATTKSLNSSHQDLLHSQDSKTARQRITEARRSTFLDLSGLSLQLLPEDVWEMENLRAILLGNNNFTQVPPNLANTFPNLQYLDMSNNHLAHIPSNMADMPEILVLDFSRNEALAGTQLPSAFGPIRHRVAVFIDDESVEFVEPGATRSRTATNGKNADDEDGNEKDQEDGDAEEYHEADEEEPQEYKDPNTNNSEDEDSDDDDDNQQPTTSGLHDRTVHKRHDLLEDISLKQRKFMRMIKDLEDAADLQGFFKRLLAAKDTMFIKYLSKRYHSVDGAVTDGESSEAGSDDGEDVVSARERRREQREMDHQERKEKEKYVKGSRAAGRKLKASMLSE